MENYKFKKSKRYLVILVFALFLRCLGTLLLLLSLKYFVYILYNGCFLKVLRLYFHHDGKMFAILWFIFRSEEFKKKILPFTSTSILTRIYMDRVWNVRNYCLVIIVHNLPTVYKAMQCLQVIHQFLIKRNQDRHCRGNCKHLKIIIQLKLNRYRSKRSLSLKKCWLHEDLPLTSPLLTNKSRRGRLFKFVSDEFDRSNALAVYEFRALW